MTLSSFFLLFLLMHWGKFALDILGSFHDSKSNIKGLGGNNNVPHSCPVGVPRQHSALGGAAEHALRLLGVGRQLAPQQAQHALALAPMPEAVGPSLCRSLPA